MQMRSLTATSGWRSTAATVKSAGGGIEPQAQRCRSRSAKAAKIQITGSQMASECGILARRRFSTADAEPLSLAAGGMHIVSESKATELVREYWRLMATNDFAAVAAVLSPDFVLDWPQSKERIRGSERFARMNQEYPAHGRWEFAINRIVGGESEAASDVSVTDGVQLARVISFFTVAHGKITYMVEFWPEPYPAPDNRAHLVEAIP